MEMGKWRFDRSPRRWHMPADEFTQAQSLSKSSALEHTSHGLAPPKQKFRIAFRAKCLPPQPESVRNGMSIMTNFDQADMVNEKTGL